MALLKYSDCVILAISRMIFRCLSSVSASSGSAGAFSGSSSSELVTIESISDSFSTVHSSYFPAGLYLYPRQFFGNAGLVLVSFCSVSCDSSPGIGLGDDSGGSSSRNSFLRFVSRVIVIPPIEITKRNNETYGKTNKQTNKANSPE